MHKRLRVPQGAAGQFLDLVDPVQQGVAVDVQFLCGIRRAAQV